MVRVMAELETWRRGIPAYNNYAAGFTPEMGLAWIYRSAGNSEYLFVWRVLARMERSPHRHDARKAKTFKTGAASAFARNTVSIIALAIIFSPKT